MVVMGHLNILLCCRLFGNIHFFEVRAFALDFSDGEIRYKTSLDVEADRLTPTLVKQLIHANVLTLDNYLPGILAVMEGVSSPEEAIAAVET